MIFHMHRSFLRVAAGFLLLWGQAGLAHGLEECLKPGWPSERSDLRPDPAVTRGTLDNGMRYAVMENREPEDRVALFLYIHAGSLYETAEQRGVAHFLEHMLFNGTTHFPPGELIKFFQNIGMNYGGDTNAHTGYDETVYRLDLPEGTKEVLRKGLLVLADYARGALLVESEVDRERGVILSEKRSRDSAQYRSMVAATEFKFAGTLLPKRQIIGEESVLSKADSALLRSYYDSWYRPENMLLVVVGDVERDMAVSLIGEMFSPLRAEGEMPACPDFGKVDHSGLEVFYRHDDELGKTNVAIETFQNITPIDDSRQLEREELYRYASMMILNNRLKRLQEEKGEVFTGAGYYSGDMLQRVRTSSIMADTRPDKWRETLGLLDHTLRQALRHGVLAGEVDRAKRDILASLDAAVLTSGSRQSERLGQEFIRHFSDNRVFLSPQQERELYGGFLADMQIEDVNRILRQDWAQDNRIVSLTGDVVVDADNPKQLISRIYRAAASQDTEPYLDALAGRFPYLTVPAETEEVLKEQKTYSAIDAERLEFANNIAVTFKRTDFEPNTVRILVDVGQGKLSEPRPGLSLLGEEVVNESGTGRLPPSALAEVLAGTTVNVRFSVGEESFRYSGRAVTTETELLLQLLYHLLQDPGLREQAYVHARNDINQMYDRLAADVQGAVSLKVERFLAGGDPRVGMPSWEQVDSLQFEQLRQWLLPQLRQGSMEVAVVGDFDPVHLRGLLSKYFGTMGERKKNQAESSTLNFPEGRQLQVEVGSSVEKSLVIAAWPTAGFWDIQRTRRLHVLAEIMQERLRQVIREKLGASYAPAVFSAPSRVYGDYGNLQVQVVVAPGREEEILGRITEIAQRLRKDSIDGSELARIKGPLLAHLKEAVRTNQYWLNSVLAGSDRHPQQLEWPESMMADFSAVSAAEVEQLARRYLLPDKMATAVVRPKGTP